MEGFHIFMYFVQWLVHESDATWDFVWTVFLTSKITVNLVRLASVNRWSRRQLRKFFQQKYAKFRRELNQYRKVTAWYDALDCFRESLNIGVAREVEIDWMMAELLRFEGNYSIATCQSCLMQDEQECYQIHLNMCFDDDCSWCHNIQSCWDCDDSPLFGTHYCRWHQDIVTARKKLSDKCSCRSVRCVDDKHFLDVVKSLVPNLEALGWQFHWWKNERGVPRLEIVSPDDLLTESEDLACQYYNE